MLVRFLGLICLLPFILANSHCEPMYQLLGMGNLSDPFSDAEEQAVELPLDETPFLKLEAEETSDSSFVGCDVSSFSQFIGDNYTLIKDDINIKLNFRLIYPHTMITYDYQPSRVNLIINDTGDVDRIYCG